jgi:hypothetical protein
MEILFNALRALWAALKAQSASKAAAELPQGTSQVKAVEADLAEITAELARDATASVSPTQLTPK